MYQGIGRGRDLLAWLILEFGFLFITIRFKVPMSTFLVLKGCYGSFSIV
jgi:hypothetical protein